MGSAAATGTLHGKVIDLDDALPALDGKRVRVLVEPEESPATDDDQASRLSSDDQRRLWAEWVRLGPQGPLEVEGETDFP
jgi:hypothetical protein